MLEDWNRASAQAPIEQGKPMMVERLGDQIWGLADWSFQGQHAFVEQYGLMQLIPAVDAAMPPRIVGFHPVPTKRLVSPSWADFRAGMQRMASMLDGIACDIPS
ncbi:MAG TPA: hypothetical protein VFH47_04030 [Candidatus Thermoplasmatota archaeon]|nr:hypothetical protein [Candidatus Thermoplasmatota archaeon]